MTKVLPHLRFVQLNSKENGQIRKSQRRKFFNLQANSSYKSFSEKKMVDRQQNIIADGCTEKLSAAVFLIPGASSNLRATSNRFLGIWYSKLPNHPDAVWVGNPETPVLDSSGVSTLSRWELNTWGQLLQSILGSDGTTWETTVTSPCTSNPDYPDAVCIKQTTSECRNGSELFLPVRGYSGDAKLTYNDSNTNLDLSDYGTPTEKESTKRKWWIWCIVGIVLAVAVLLLGYFCYTRKRKLLHVQQTDKAETIQEQGLLDLGSQISGLGDIFKLKFGKSRGLEFKMFSFPELVTATDDFSFARRLGEGGFGPVYKGVLPDGQQVAVKRLARHSGQGLEEFMNEITLIAELQHSNLVRLLGCCIQGEEKILIYEYLTNTSLDAFLFDSTRVYLLDWQRRINIIEGIAQGLLYLHKHSRVRVIHRDLKASNILLDESMKPKISDFGMARIFGQNESRANTNRVVGTYGYMSPEYAMNGIFSEKSDVYSFGVLLLEIVSGRKNTVFVSSTNLSLIELAWSLWKKGDCLEIRDPSMDSCPEDEVTKYVHVGLLCVQEYAADRPTMSEVLSMLTSDIIFLPDPKQPAFCVSNSESGSSQAERRLDMGSSNGLSITVMEPR
ncbi:G-type lectin S-receptor-like serine/threonine-protein kinase [Pyrus ussuriensis x Pyrus communis]|uniref:non-specific serine/threonine protein kinase n=1 Tax=Pyrus ussuriensis x Pyrus communis TaxID=2448454 RepID=A0A5N5FC05_9ROSA|nr:G-type lectin S-receptor-like serine/threonine-protein kinase [Pyrus ussuriensis x Pyrus communis]